MILRLNSDEKNTIKLRVLAAKNISENLLSLRRFADLGFGIYLDDRIIRIFEKDTGVPYLSGKYVKLNWFITLHVQKPIEFSEKSCVRVKYICKDKMVQLNDFTAQSQTDVSDERNVSEIGRETDELEHQR